MASATTAAQCIQTFRPACSTHEENRSQAGIDLCIGELWLVKGKHRWRAILCLEGAIWVTQDRDVRDHIIKAGEMFLISQPGEVTIQALADARLKITPCLANAPSRGRGFAGDILP